MFLKRFSTFIKGSLVLWVIHNLEICIQFSLLPWIAYLTSGKSRLFYFLMYWSKYNKRIWYHDGNYCLYYIEIFALGYCYCFIQNSNANDPAQWPQTKGDKGNCISYLNALWVDGCVEPVISMDFAILGGMWFEKPFYLSCIPMPNSRT